MYYKLRKKWLRFIQTIRANNDSNFKIHWSPQYRLEYCRMYRHYLKTLKDSIEISYE